MGAIWDGFKEILAALIALIYQVVPNFGLTIIILTVLLNILVFPLTLKQTRSARAMQEIQPEVKKLQKKYKDDPESMNKEMMALYRERGVNPAGCLLPMLVQFPIWIALFRVLSIECAPGLSCPPSEMQPQLLRLLESGTRLYGDLEAETLGNFLGMDLFKSASDVFSLDGLVGALPYVFLILIVVVSQFVQQRMLTPPSASQDSQARQMQGIMKIMPLFFGFISWSLPAGLVVYFATSNLFRIGQQQLIFKIDGRPDAPKEKAKEDPDQPDDPKPMPEQGSAKKRGRRRRK